MEKIEEPQRQVRYSTASSTVSAYSKQAPRTRKIGTGNDEALPSSLVDQLVDTSSRHIDEMLKELNTLIRGETDAARKESLVKIRWNALRERANFRVLSRHVAAAAPKNLLDKADDNYASSADKDDSYLRKEFQSLPEKLTAKFVRELPGWCVHIERPEIVHLGHCRYDATDREFFCDAVVSLLQRPDAPDRVFVNILFLDPETNDVAKRNQRFSFPVEDVLATLVPLLKSAEGKWTQQSRRRLAEAAAEEAAAPDDHVKSEPTEEISNLNDDSMPVPVSPTRDSLLTPPTPSMSKPSDAPVIGNRKPHFVMSQEVILEGKRRRKPRMSQEAVREALEDFDDDVMDEDDENKMLYDRALKDREQDEDFDPGPDIRLQLHDSDVLGRCCHCNDYLRKEQALTHMADKHPEDITRRLNCPICDKATSVSLEEHLQKSHSERFRDGRRRPPRTETAVFCPLCPRSFLRNEYRDEHVVEVHKPEEKNAVCDECDLKFASERLVGKHKAQSHPEKPEDGENDGEQTKKPPAKVNRRKHICHICAKECINKEKLEGHLILVHETKTRDFQCPACPSVFATRMHLVTHLQKVHTDEKRFECPVCKKRFKTTSHLRQHSNSHGPPKFACQYCGNKFSFKTGLVNHVKSVHKDQPMPSAQTWVDENSGEPEEDY